MVFKDVIGIVVESLLLMDGVITSKAKGVGTLIKYCGDDTYNLITKLKSVISVE